MSKFPGTRHEMKRARYEFKSASHCKACQRPIEWWKTTNGKMMPFDPMLTEDSAAVSHWGTCPQAEEFRQPASKLARLQSETSALRDRTGARAVVLISEDGTAAAWRNGIPAEDLRHELITAANHVRNSVSKGDQ